MQSKREHPLYRDSSVSTEKRVEDLLDRMTLEEKVGQLVGTWAGQLEEFKSVDDVADEVRDHNVGAVASFGWGGAVDKRLDAIVENVNRLQEVALSETRLGIPLLFNVDAVHGHAYVAEGTAFPNGLGVGATWDVEATERVAGITATEVRRSGAHQNYSPTCDVARDPRWGRTFETFGESPYLCGKLAAAKVRGYQGDGLEDSSSVVATAKHFPAYSEPARGEDAAPVEISEYLLRNVFLPSFVDALDSDVESVMPCYNAIDGEPAHGSRRYLTDLLRGTLGFDGTVVSDWGGVKKLDEDHRITDDHRDSVRQTREAGLDIASVDAVEHADHLVSLVEEGEPVGASSGKRTTTGSAATAAGGTRSTASTTTNRRATSLASRVGVARSRRSARARTSAGSWRPRRSAATRETASKTTTRSSRRPSISRPTASPRGARTPPRSRCPSTCCGTSSYRPSSRRSTRASSRSCRVTTPSTASRRTGRGDTSRSCSGGRSASTGPSSPTGTASGCSTTTTR